jgi:hypothetical protein
MTITKKALILLVCIGLVPSVFAEEQHMDLSLLEGVTHLGEADKIYKNWKQTLPEENSNSEEKPSPEEENDEGMEEDRYQAWRQGAINHVDENGNLNWNYRFNSPKPTLNQPAPNTPDWTQIGPFDFDISKNTGYNPGIGRLQTIEIDPSDSNTLYVGTPAGGLWKTSNLGGSWTNLMKEVGNHGVAGIAVSPTNSNIVVVATGEGDGMGAPMGTGIYRSTDGGLSWILVQNYNAIGKNISFHPSNSQKILAATSNVLYLSTDAGLTWTTVSGVNGIHDAEWHKGDEDYLYYSKSSGVTQYKISTASSSTVSGLPSSSQIKIETSTDAPDKLFVLCALSNKLSGFYVWDSKAKSIIKSYTQASGGKNILGYDNLGGWTSSGFTWYAMGFGVSDEDANLISAGSPLVWRSTDGGTTFTHGDYRWSEWKKDGYNHPDIHDMDYQGSRHFVISDGGIRYSDNNGLNYTDISKGISAIASYQWSQSPLDGSYQVTGLQDIGNFVKRGGTWYTTAGGDGYGGFVDVSDKDIMYFVQGGTRRSTTGNFMAGYSTASSSGVKYMAQSISNPNNMVGAGEGGFHYSTDRGVSWMAANGAMKTGKSLCISPVDENIVWGTAGGKLYKSTNKGQSWSSVSGLSGNVNDVTCDSQNANVAWAVVSGTAIQKVYKTINGGNVWSNITSAVLDGQSVREITHDSKDKGGIYIGTQTGVYYYNDDIADWVNWSAGLPWTQIQEMSVHKVEQKLRLASWGRGIWESELYTEGGASSSQAVSSSLIGSSQGLSSSFVNSSSSVLSSSVVSSSAILSSSVTLSSSVIADICDGVPAWEAQSYNWKPTKEFVTYSDKLYSHSDWVSSMAPDKNAGWNFEGDCLLANSSVTVSSSEANSSSSEVIVANTVVKSFKLLAQYESGLLLIDRLNLKINTQVVIVNSNGKSFLNQSKMTKEWILDLSKFTKGVYFLKIKNGLNSLNTQFNIQ